MLPYIPESGTFPQPPPSVANIWGPPTATATPTPRSAGGYLVTGTATATTAPPSVTPSPALASAEAQDHDISALKTVEGILKELPCEDVELIYQVLTGLTSIDRKDGSPVSSCASSVSDCSKEENHNTLHIKNVPYGYTCWDIVALLEFYGFPRGKDYKLLYAPINFENNQNRGYFFLVCRSKEMACKILKKLDGEWIQHHRPCKVEWARIQGKRNNIAHFRSTGLNRADIPLEWKPIPFNRKGEFVHLVPDVPTSFHPSPMSVPPPPPLPTHHSLGMYPSVPQRRSMLSSGGGPSVNSVVQTKEVSKTKVMLCGLPKGYTEGQLKELLQNFGEVRDIDIIETHLKRYAFAEFHKEGTAQDCLRGLLLLPNVPQGLIAKPYRPGFVRGGSGPPYWSQKPRNPASSALMKFRTPTDAHKTSVDAC